MVVFSSSAASATIKNFARTVDFIELLKIFRFISDYLWFLDSFEKLQLKRTFDALNYI
ncbi:hypothetical protein PGB90_005508 [Kerria lacca]